MSLLKPAIPTYILTGYLGAGKTTLLQTLLPYWYEQGLRPAVLMNEFGSISVDSLLLQQGSNAPVVDLLDGCICCTLKGSVSETIIELVETYQPDVLVIETTGVASPIDLVQVLAAPDLLPRVELAGVFTVVNARRFPVGEAVAELTANERTMREQVESADALLVTKTDLVEPADVERLLTDLHRLNPVAQPFVVVQGAIDPEALLQVKAKRSAAMREQAGATASADAAVAKPKGLLRRAGAKVGAKAQIREKTPSFGTLTTYSREFQEPVQVEALYRLLHNLPPSVVRGKGFFVDSETHTLLEFQYAAPNQVTFGESGFLHGRSFALFIGERVGELGLDEQLQACEVRKRERT